MTKLNDLQLVLLSAAAQRDDGSLLPPPDHLTDQTARIAKVIPALLKRGLVEETQTDVPSKAWREDGAMRFALVITDVGRAAIGIDQPHETHDITEPAIALIPATDGLVASAEPLIKRFDTQTSARPCVPDGDTPPAPASKIDIVLSLMRREEGASLDEMVTATNWLPHSTRAALTGLRKKGHAIARRTVNERSRYFIDSAGIEGVAEITAPAQPATSAKIDAQSVAA